MLSIICLAKQSITSQDDYITLFVNEYKKQAPQGTLAELFATQQLKDKVNTRSTDAEVEKVLREEVQAAIDNSYNVLRTRIDRFGVAQPNIQTLEGKMGRIMVELPGIKEPERVRKLLQGSANLEFWETYNSNEIVPSLQETYRERMAPAGLRGGVWLCRRDWICVFNRKHVPFDFEGSLWQK